MPGRDGTGPLGQGPATGRGVGPCRKEKDTYKGYPRGARRAKQEFLRFRRRNKNSSNLSG